MISCKLDFGAAENIKEAVLNKYYNFVGNWDFASIGTMNNEPATYAQDIESLAYCLLYSLNGGWLTWGSYPNAPTVNHVENIEKKTALDLDVSQFFQFIYKSQSFIKHTVY